MAKTENKNIFVIPSYNQCFFVYLHILLFIPEQALPISGRSLFFYGMSTR